MWQETSGSGSTAQSGVDKAKQGIVAARATMQGAGTGISDNQQQWEATDAANTQAELQSRTEVQHSVLSERLQRLEARVSLHTSTNKQQQHQQQQHSHQQPQHHTADVASAALRQSLLLEERSLELGHRDMLLRRARDSIATLQSELESMRAAEHREHQARLELEHCLQERDAVQAELHATRRHSAEAAAALEAEVLRLRREKEQEAAAAQAARQQAAAAQDASGRDGESLRSTTELLQQARSAVAALQEQALHRDGLEGELSRARDELKGILKAYNVTTALQCFVYCDKLLYNSRISDINLLLRSNNVSLQDATAVAADRAASLRKQDAAVLTADVTRLTKQLDTERRRSLEALRERDAANSETTRIAHSLELYSISKTVQDMHIRAALQSHVGLCDAEYSSRIGCFTAALHFLAQSELALLAVLTCKYNTSNTNACAVEQEAVGDVDALKLANEHLELTLQRCATRADREVTSLRTALEAAQTEAEE
eukprot:15662-Heterococcus_DN1.PRE.3